MSNPVGRPKKAAKNKLSRQIQVRLAPAELRALDARVLAECFASRSTYLRMLVKKDTGLIDY